MEVSHTLAIQQPQQGVEDLRIPAAWEHQVPPCGQKRGPPLSFGRGLLAQLRGRGGKRRPERRGREVLPYLCGDLEKEEKGLETKDTAKKRRKKRRIHIVSPPLRLIVVC